jgi:hypothetical protein
MAFYLIHVRGHPNSVPQADHFSIFAYIGIAAWEAAELRVLVVCHDMVVWKVRVLDLFDTTE